MARLRIACCVVSCLLGMAAVAVADQPPDAEIAHHYFAAGRSAYAQDRFAEALEAFRAADRLVSLPALDYDIGLCLERLGRHDEAVAAFRRFLAASPSAPEAAEVRVHMESLERGPASRRRALRSASIAVGVVALALGATGAGLLGSAAVDYGALHDGCGVAGDCARASYAGVERRDLAGKGLLGVAGAALVIDLGLWIAYARKAHR